MKLIDSHCHLPHTLEPATGWVQEALEAGIEKIINVGTSLKDSTKALKTANNFENVYSTVSVYPHEDRTITVLEIEKQLTKFLETELPSGKVVAIGETGLDITDWQKGRSIEEQLKLFEIHLNLANKFKLPLIIHNRNGDERLLQFLRRAKLENPELKGVAHSFSSTLETAQELIELGFYISFSGMITYPSRKELREVLKELPLEHVLVETDSPYLPPQGHRGEENRPKYVKIVAEKIAEVTGKTAEEIAVQTHKNTCSVFNL
jgi:TatD DNase family protein